MFPIIVTHSFQCICIYRQIQDFREQSPRIFKSIIRYKNAALSNIRLCKPLKQSRFPIQTCQTRISRYYHKYLRDRIKNQTLIIKQLLNQIVIHFRIIFKNLLNSTLTLMKQGRNIHILFAKMYKQREKNQINKEKYKRNYFPETTISHFHASFV